jgi:hypothetical protein
MDTEAGPMELLVGLDNSQWLLIHLEDSQNQEDNTRLMKSSFGHRFMIMGEWGTGFYPRDASMRYRGDATGGQAGNSGGAQKAQLQEYCGRSRGAGDRGRAESEGSPPPKQVDPCSRARGARGHQRGQGRHSVQGELPRDPLST